MFKTPYNGIENTFIQHKNYSLSLFKEHKVNEEFFGTQLTLSYADRLSLFLGSYPAILEKIQELITQNNSDEEIIRKILIKLVNKEFGSYELSLLLKICITIVISISSKCKIDYPFEIIDVEFSDSNKTIVVKISNLVSFLSQKSIIILICSLTYLLEEVHTIKGNNFDPEKIEELLNDFYKIDQSPLWAKEEIIYQFLIRLNFLLDIQENGSISDENEILMYFLRSIADEIDFFELMCEYFAINRWNSLFTNKKNPVFYKTNVANNFLSVINIFFPVFSSLDNSGFRILKGKARNTGFGTVGISNAAIQILKFLSPGDQIRLEFPFKFFQVQCIDSIEGPYVRLKDNRFLKLNTVEELKTEQQNIIEILNLGDMLICEIDLPNNFQHEYIGKNHLSWIKVAILSFNHVTDQNQHVLEEIFNLKFVKNEKISFINFFIDYLMNNESEITSFRSVALYKTFSIPIHPRWTPRWKKLTNKQWRLFRTWIRKTRYWEATNKSFKIHQIEGEYDPNIEQILKEGEVCFHIIDNKIKIIEFGSIFYFIFLDPSHDLGEIEPSENIFSPISFLNKSNKIRFHIEEIFRVNCSLQNINISYIESTSGNIHGFIHPKSNEEISLVKTRLAELNSGLEFEQLNFPKTENINLEQFSDKLVLDKTILRAKNNLTVFKDGLIHFSVINSPLTSFKPIEINVSVEQLHSLGYYYDIYGHLLENSQQEVLLKPSDIIIPENLLEQIINVMRFINDELKLIYDKEPFYDISMESNSIIGLNVIGINKNYSIGIFGRVIGYSSVSTCFATPIWHLSKGSYCNGEMSDSFVLDLDCFLNLDIRLIISKIGMFRGIPIFTQIQPDLSISSATLEKFSGGFFNKFVYEKESHSKDSTQHINDFISYIKYNSQFNQFSVIYTADKINPIVSRNELLTIPGQIEKLISFFEYSTILKTIDIIKIFNGSISAFIYNNILPMINNFFKADFLCPSCNNRIDVIINEHCLVCNNILDFSNVIMKIEYNYHQIQQLIAKFEKFKLSESTKNLLKYAELQLEGFFLR
jgi:hypothetical protein